MKKTFFNGGVILIVLLIGLYTRHVRTQTRHEVLAAAQRNDARIAKSQAMQDKQLCVQIELVKTLIRQQENEGFRNRFRNLKLLGVPATREILGVVESDHQKHLLKLHRHDCSIHSPIEEVKP